MADSIMDPELVMRRVYVALLFHAARCVLHRKYLVHAKTDATIDATFTYSHDTHQSCDADIAYPAGDGSGGADWRTVVPESMERLVGYKARVLARDDDSVP